MYQLINIQSRRILCDFLYCNRIRSVASKQDYLCADRHIRNIRYIYHALIHADVSDHRRKTSIYNHPRLRRISSWNSVGKTKRKRRDFSLLGRHVFSSIADSIALLNLFYIYDLRLDRHRKFEWQSFLLYLVRWVHAVDHKARPAEFKNRLRHIDNRRTACNRPSRNLNPIISKLVIYFEKALQLYIAKSLVCLVRCRKMRVKCDDLEIRKFCNFLRLLDESLSISAHQSDSRKACINREKTFGRNAKLSGCIAERLGITVTANDRHNSICNGNLSELIQDYSHYKNIFLCARLSQGQSLFKSCNRKIFEAVISKHLRDWKNSEAVSIRLHYTNRLAITDKLLNILYVVINSIKVNLNPRRSQNFISHILHYPYKYSKYRIIIPSNYNSEHQLA